MTITNESENLKLLRETWELAPNGPEKDEALARYQTELNKTGGPVPHPSEDTLLEKAVDALK
jgi:hypothetical protein